MVVGTELTGKLFFPNNGYDNIKSWYIMEVYKTGIHFIPGQPGLSRETLSLEKKRIVFTPMWVPPIPH